MKATELKSRLDSPRPPALLHVLPEDVFAALRIAGSLNACVYEMAFAGQVSGLLPDKSLPVVVYGAGDGSQDARVAAEVLRGLGHESVEEFAGGLKEWREAGLPLEGHGALPGGEFPADGEYRVDTEASIIRWTGRNLFNHHSGTVKLSGGQLSLADGLVTSADFSIDMRSIACEDLADAQYNSLLLRHLANADFFDTEHHPEARFVAHSCEPVQGAAPGSPNFRLSGAFTLRGVSRPLTFPLVAANAGDGRIAGQALIDLDRTEFGSIYGSGRFFRFLGQHVVNDIVHLHVKIHATRA